MDENSGLSTESMLSIGERIKRQRFRLDQSLEEFASFLGVSPERLQAWERGENIKHSVLNLISDRTGESLHWLIAGLTPHQTENIRLKAARCMHKRKHDRRSKPGEIDDAECASPGVRERESD